MDWKKIAPWNWFKEEEPAAAAMPVRADDARDPFAAMRSEMERLFEESFGRAFATTPALHEGAQRVAAPIRPSVDISEGKKAYLVRAELPGVELEDISIEVEGQTLVIRAEKRQESEEQEQGYHCIERSYGAVQRVLSLPDDADAEAIGARFKNGLLKLEIPKHEALASGARNIEIQAI